MSHPPNQIDHPLAHSGILLILFQIIPLPLMLSSFQLLLQQLFGSSCHSFSQKTNPQQRRAVMQLELYNNFVLLQVLCSIKIILFFGAVTVVPFPPELFPSSLFFLLLKYVFI